MSITYVGFSVEMNGINLMSAVDMEALRKQVELAVRVVHPSQPGSNFEDAVRVHIIEHAGKGLDEEDFTC